MEGWKVKPLGELCDFQRGLTYSKKDEVDVSKNIVLRANNIDINSYHMKLKELRYISDQVSVPDKKKVRKSSILICTASGSKNHLGKAAYIDKDYNYAFGGFLGMITPFNELVPKYLLYAMMTDSYKEHIASLADGTNINNLKFKDIRSFEVVYPSIPEQQRIVANLDEAFVVIDRAKANAEKNLLNARELFEGYLQSVFTQRGEGWLETTIGENIKFIDYRGKTPKKTKEGLRLITAKNVKMGYLQDHPREYISPEDYDGWMVRGIPQAGDVLFTTEAPLANVAQLDTDEKVVFAQRIIIMQPDSKVIDNTFLKYILMSPIIQERIHSKGTGATVKGIKAKLLKAIAITFPRSLDVQREIVRKIDLYRDETHHLESIYTKKLAALDEFKKSLLDQAFTGKL